MSTLLLADMAGFFLGWLMAFLSVFLIMLILIQRGKGGGLTGALGGPGGQSAFGSKAGDTFTLITIVVASVWGLTCAFTMWLLGAHASATPVTKSQLKAGPGDEAQSPDSNAMPLNPSGSGFNIGDGLEGLSSGEQTPSMDLIPKTSDPQPSSDSGDQPDAGTNESSEGDVSPAEATDTDEDADTTLNSPDGVESAEAPESSASGESGGK